MQKIMLALFVTSVLSGCSVFGVYKVDIPQGTPLTKAQASQVQVGMSFQLSLRQRAFFRRYKA